MSDAQIPAFDEVLVTVRPIRPIAYFDPPCCPICLATTDLTAEHVPPESLGGHVLTRTCGPCNHTLGSRADEPFRLWTFQRFRSARLSFPDSSLRGRRKVKSIEFRTDDGGKPYVVLDPGQDPELLEVMADGGQFQFEARQPDPNAIWLGEAKNIYLSCCAIAGKILDGPTALRVRQMLVSAVEPAWKPKPENSPFAGRLRLSRPATSAPPLPASIARMETGERSIPAIAWTGYATEVPFLDDPDLALIADNWPT